jgi:hypothetical protein
MLPYYHYGNRAAFCTDNICASNIWPIHFGAKRQNKDKIGRRGDTVSYSASGKPITSQFIGFIFSVLQ